MILFHLVLLSLTIIVNTNNFDNTGKTVIFYPSSLMLASNPRAVFFYHDTQILNFVLKLNIVPLGITF